MFSVLGSSSETWGSPFNLSEPCLESGASGLGWRRRCTWGWWPHGAPRVALPASVPRVAGGQALRQPFLLQLGPPTREEQEADVFLASSLSKHSKHTTPTCWVQEHLPYLLLQVPARHT